MRGHIALIEAASLRVRRAGREDHSLMKNVGGGLARGTCGRSMALDQVTPTICG